MEGGRGGVEVVSLLSFSLSFCCPPCQAEDVGELLMPHTSSLPPLCWRWQFSRAQEQPAWACTLTLSSRWSMRWTGVQNWEYFMACFCSQCRLHVSPPGYSTYLLPPLNIHTDLRGIDKRKLLWASGHGSPQPSRTAQCKYPWDASSALQRCYINKNDCIQICRNTYSTTHVPLSLPQEISSLHYAREGQSF